MKYVSSDFHHSHINLCKGISKWSDKSGCRDFNTLEEMNTTIINNINSVVMPDDELYCLGDWAFGNIQKNAFELREQINCSKVHIIWGNHDSKLKTLNPRSMFESCQDYKEFYYAKQGFVLFHYPIASWNGMSTGKSYMLHGHTHRCPQQKYINGPKSMDVGLDGNDYKPYSIDEIIDIMKNQPTKTEGHHT